MNLGIILILSGSLIHKTQIHKVKWKTHEKHLTQYLK